MKLDIAENLIVPKAILNQHVVVLGKTGSGKSSALRHIVEHLLVNKKRVCITDPKGDWWGIKLGPDGKSPGFPMVLFGDFKNPDARDVPINDHSGKHVAKLIADGNRPAVIGFRGWTQGAMTRFWIDFASGLFNANSGELYLIGDEFHNFAPKQWKGISDKDTPVGVGLHWANRLLSEGRGIGLVCLLASQRPQKVHNDTLTSCETLVAMRVVHAADRAAIKAWIDGAGDPERGADVLNTLAEMQRGEAWVWSPEAGFGPKRIKFPMFHTFDSFAPPQLQNKVSAKGWADVDLEAVKSELHEVIEQAKANDPAELKREVARLKVELQKRPTETKIETKTERVEVPVLKNGQLDKAHRLIDRLEKIAAPIVGAAKELASVIGTGLAAAAPVDWAAAKAGLPAAPGTRLPPPVRRPAPIRRPIAERVAVNDGGELTGPEQRILDALAWLESIGVQGPEQTAVAFLAGYTIGGGAFNNPKGKLRGKGLIEYLSGDCLMLTDSGRELANRPDTPLTADELQRMVMQRLPGPEQRILRPLLDAYPNDLSNEELAAAAGYEPNGGAFNNPRGRLRSLGLIEYRSGRVRARPILFLE